MKSIFSLLLVMGVNSARELEENYFDIVGKLPIEIAVMILRKLDPQTLVSASRVNGRWFALCKSDRVLRKRIKDEICRVRMQHIMPLKVNILHTTQNGHKRVTFAAWYPSKYYCVSFGLLTYRRYSTGNVSVHEPRVLPYKVPGKQNRPHRTEIHKNGHSNTDTKSSKRLRF